MSTNSHPSENTLVSNHSTNSLESSIDDSLPTLLPRSAWNSQVAYLRVLFRAKKALDRIEQEARVLKSSLLFTVSGKPLSKSLSYEERDFQ